MNDGAERVEPGEEEAFKYIAQFLAEQVRKDHASHGAPARRDQHPKHHGLVRAELTVLSDLPAELKVGVFKEAERRYDAWIRFSNGSSKMQPDQVPDGRGMALKLLGVEGAKLLEDESDARTQDFVLLNHHTFFVRNTADYVELFKAAESGRIGRFFFGGLNPLRWRLREFKRAGATRARIANTLTTQYWSTVPFGMGTTPARFSARPREVAAPPGKEQLPASPDYLRERMVEHLSARPAVFDFLVQLQTDPKAMPVEDPTVVWDEQKSPYRPVATITIPPQKFTSDGQLALAEHLSFTPWHSIAEHRPLGAINRARKSVYREISRLRHELNGVERKEPTELATF